MKKIAAIMVLLAFELSGCQKIDHQEYAIEELSNNVAKITELSDSELLLKYSTIQLKPNEYSFVGELVYNGMVKFEKIVLEQGAKGIAVDSLIPSIIYSTIPSEYSLLNDKNLTETEGDIYKKIVVSLAETKTVNVFYKLSIIEDIISRDEAIDENAKIRLLVFISVYKYTCEFFNDLSMNCKKETFDECFRRKMNRIFNEGGVLERLHCVSTWPMCLSIAAGDCIIDQIIKTK